MPKPDGTDESDVVADFADCMEDRHGWERVAEELRVPTTADGEWQSDVPLDRYRRKIDLVIEDSSGVHWIVEAKRSWGTLQFDTALGQAQMSEFLYRRESGRPASRTQPTMLFGEPPTLHESAVELDLEDQTSDSSRTPLLTVPNRDGGGYERVLYDELTAAANRGIEVVVDLGSPPLDAPDLDDLTSGMGAETTERVGFDREDRYALLTGLGYE